MRSWLALALLLGCGTEADPDLLDGGSTTAAADTSSGSDSTAPTPSTSGGSVPQPSSSGATPPPDETGSEGGETGSIGETCVDGVDCPCDRIADPSDPLFDEDLLFCEDFEALALDDQGKGWSDAYGPPGSGCFINGEDWNTNGSIEGTCETCCINVVQEGNCEVSGEQDCVFHGGQSLGHRLEPGRTGGIVGWGNFARMTRRFGVTYALRYSPNFVDPSPAMKTNEFGDGLHCILGCATNNNFGRNVPFQGVILGTSAAAGGSAVVGQAAPNDGFYNFSPAPSDYEWRVTHGPGEWVCHQLHFDNWGLPGATVRYWIDGQLVTHVEDVDLSVVFNDADGIDKFAWNHYYNDGYAGPDIAYRYEDNFVVTAAAEPVPCGAIGF